MEETLISQAKVINQLTSKVALKEEDEEKLRKRHEEQLLKKDDVIGSLQVQIKGLENELDNMKEMEQQRERESNNSQSVESLLPGFRHSLYLAQSLHPRQNIKAILNDLRTRTDAAKVVFYELSQSSRQLKISCSVHQCHGKESGTERKMDVTFPIGVGIVGTFVDEALKHTGNNIDLEVCIKKVDSAEDAEHFVRVIDLASGEESHEDNFSQTPICVCPVVQSERADDTGLFGCISLIGQSRTADGEKHYITEIDKKYAIACSTAISRILHDEERKASLLRNETVAQSILNIATESPFLEQQNLYSFASQLVSATINRLNCCAAVYFQVSTQENRCVPKGLKISKAETEDFFALCRGNALDAVDAIQRIKLYASHLGAASGGLLSPIFEMLKISTATFDKRCLDHLQYICSSEYLFSSATLHALNQSPESYSFLESVAKYTASQKFKELVCVDVAQPEKWRNFLSQISAGISVTRKSAINMRHIRSLVAAPIRRNKAVVGVIIALNKFGSEAFMADDLSYLTRAASTAGTALKIVSSLETHTMRISKRMQILNEVDALIREDCSDLLKQVDFPRVLSQINYLIHKGMGSCRYVEIVHTTDSDSHSTICVRRGDRFLDQVRNGSAWENGAYNVVRHVRRHRRVIIASKKDPRESKSSDLDTSDSWIFNPLENILKEKVHSVLCAPILHPLSSMILGVVLCVNKCDDEDLPEQSAPLPFDHIDGELLTTVASKLGRVFENYLHLPSKYLMFSHESCEAIEAKLPSYRKEILGELRNQRILHETELDRLREYFAESIQTAEVVSMEALVQSNQSGLQNNAWKKKLRVFFLCVRVLGKLLLQLQRFRRKKIEGADGRPSGKPEMKYLASQLRTWNFCELEMNNDDLESSGVMLFKSLPFYIEYNIPLSRIRKFFVQIRRSHYENAYHNFKHGFFVMRVVYNIITRFMEHGRSRYSSRELLSHLVAAIAVDVSHPGKSNEIEIDRQSSLALRYNDTHIYENLHASVLFQIMLDTKADVFGTMNAADRRLSRKEIISAIIHTDSSCHFDLIRDLQLCQNLEAPDNKQLKMDAILHMSDSSMYAMPTVVAVSWSNRIIEEFLLFQLSCEDSEEISKGTLFAPALPLNRKVDTLHEAAQYHLECIKTHLKPGWKIFANAFNHCGDLLRNINANIEHFNNVILSGEKNEEK